MKFSERLLAFLKSSRVTRTDLALAKLAEHFQSAKRG